jgi:hypothetical protein
MGPMLEIPALRKLRQKDYEFKTSLGYIARSCFIKQNNNNKSSDISLFPFLTPSLPFSFHKNV